MRKKNSAKHHYISGLALPSSANLISKNAKWLSVLRVKYYGALPDTWQLKLPQTFERKYISECSYGWTVSSQGDHMCSNERVH